jgi:hypothetical protein
MIDEEITKIAHDREAGDRTFVQNVLDELGISRTSAWSGRHLPYLSVLPSFVMLC